MPSAVEPKRHQSVLERASVDAFVASFPDAFVAFDAEWRFEHVNGQAERLLQASAEKLLGCSVWECSRRCGIEVRS